MAKGFTYKSYNFTEKDPIIDEIRGVVQTSGATYKHIEEQSGVCSATLHNWFDGKTRKPQAATINAVLRLAGLQARHRPMRSGPDRETPASGQALGRLRAMPSGCAAKIRAAR